MVEDHHCRRWQVGQLLEVFYDTLGMTKSPSHHLRFLPRVEVHQSQM